MDEEDRRGLGVEELLDERQGNVAVVVESGGECEGAAGFGFSDSRTGGQPPAHGVSEADGGKARHRCHQEVARVFKCAVAEDGVEDEAGVEQVDDEPHQGGVGLLREPAHLAEAVAGAQDEEHGGDGGEQGQEPRLEGIHGPLPGFRGVPDEAVVLFEGLDFGLGKSLGNPDEPVRDGLVDHPLALLAEPGLVADECDHVQAEVGSTEGFEPETAHFIELEDATEGAVHSLDGVDGGDIAFGECGHFLNHALHVAGLEHDGDQEGGAVLGVGLQMKAEIDRGAPGHSQGRDAEAEQKEHAREVHGAHIRGGKPICNP